MKSEINNSTRYCPICGARLVKNGHYSNGKIRLYCKKCKRSFLVNKNAIKKLKEHHGKVRSEKYLTQKLTIDELGYNRVSFWRHTKKQKPPSELVTYSVQKEAPFIGLDGTGIQDKVCLIASNGSKPLSVLRTDKETFDSGSNFIANLPRTKNFICDGQKGLIKAIKSIYPDANIQICLGHVKKSIQTKLTLHPKTNAGVDLLKISQFLLAKVRDKETSDLWIEGLKYWHEKYKDFIGQKTFIEGTKKGFYTHKNVRSAYHCLKHNLDNGRLFAFLKDSGIPRTNNHIEGGINSQIKKTLNNHRSGSKDSKFMSIILYLKKRSNSLRVENT